MKRKILIPKRSDKTSTAGITLVALVVTIVVLLILAGITIMYVMGDNSIFKKAQEAKDKTEQAVKDEKEYFNYIENRLNEYVNGGGTTNPPTPPEEDKTVADIVDKVQDTNKTVEDENGNKITIPGGFKVVPDTEENDVDYSYSGDKKPCVQDGIVIEDGEGNQFVWVPVGDIKNKDGSATTITLGRYTFDSTNGTPTLQQSADNYTQIVTVSGHGGSHYQELTSSSGNTAAKNLGNFIIKTKANGGYYLGRYEASKGSDNKVKTQADKVVWTDINQPNAAERAQGMYNSNYVESDLINSYSWDTAIVFIQKYSSKSNYANQDGKSINSSKQNTGKAGDKVCNIHDMASNCYEWSTEYSTYTGGSYSGPCVDRGGYCNNSGNTTSSRDSLNTTINNTGISFRPFCYVK